MKASFSLLPGETPLLLALSTGASSIESCVKVFRLKSGVDSDAWRLGVIIAAFGLAGAASGSSSSTWVVVIRGEVDV